MVLASRDQRTSKRPREEIGRRSSRFSGEKSRTRQKVEIPDRASSFAIFAYVLAERFQPPVDPVQVNRHRVEVPSYPFEHIFVVRVLLILDGLQHHVVSWNATAVFGRGSVLTLDADRIAYAFLRCPQFLDQDLVLPAVTEVVLVKETVLWLWDHLPQRNGSLALRVGHEVLVYTIDPVAGDEPVHMVILPVHDDLDDVVQLLQGGLAGEPHPAPDERFAVHEGHPDLKVGFRRSRHCSTSLPRRAGRFLRLPNHQA